MSFIISSSNLDNSEMVKIPLVVLNGWRYFNNAYYFVKIIGKNK